MKLYKFQKIGVQHLLREKKTMLCDMMGLGKTVQAVVAGDLLLKDNKVDKILIFCPNTIKQQWQSEIKKWTNRESCIVNPSKNKTYPEKQILIINYEKMISVGFYYVIREICANNKCCIILDEAQYIKGRYSKRGMRIRTLQADYKWILTGTPIMNRPDELYNINSFLGNNVLGQYYQFVTNYIVRGRYGETVGYKNLNMLHKLIDKLMLRRTREDVDIDFPAKVYEKFVVKLSGKERKIYSYITHALESDIESYERKDKAIANVLATYVMYKLICDDVSLLKFSNSPIAKQLCNKFDVNVPSTKLKELKNILDTIDGKVVLFTQFKGMANKLYNELSKYNPVLLTGDTKTCVSCLVKQFRKDSDCQLFIMTTAGKYGLDGLQVADYLILYDHLWNPKETEQIEDRIVRIGATGDHKTIIKLVVEGEDSIEEYILRVLGEKNNMINKIIGGDNNVHGR